MIKQCPLCKGEKVVHDQCSRCNGYGQLYRDKVLVNCSTCKGSGRVERRCPQCSGLGVIDTEKENQELVGVSVPEIIW